MSLSGGTDLAWTQRIVAALRAARSSGPSWGQVLGTFHADCRRPDGSVSALDARTMSCGVGSENVSYLRGVSRGAHH